MAICKWTINFDLDTKKLQQKYSRNNWKKAYKDVRKVMLENGFEHRQGSGYISKEEMSEHDITAIIDNIAEKLPWIDECSRVFDKAMADRHISCKKAIHKKVQQLKNKKEKANAQEDKDNTQEKTDDKQSVKENSQEKKENAKEEPTQKFLYSRKKLNQKAQEIAKQPQQTTDKAKSKNKNIDI